MWRALNRLPNSLERSQQMNAGAFPSESLRNQLSEIGIGLLFHEKASLLAMMERRAGVRPCEDQSADQLANALLQEESGRPTTSYRCA